MRVAPQPAARRCIPRAPRGDEKEKFRVGHQAETCRCILRCRVRGVKSAHPTIAILLLLSSIASAAEESKPAAPSSRSGTLPRIATGSHETSVPALRDQRFEPRDQVFGIIVGDEPRAYALVDLGTTGAAIHDVVAGKRLDVVMDVAGPRLTTPRTDVRETKTCGWGEWVREHPDTSLWRPSAIAEGEVTKPVETVRVTESHDYKTVLGCAFVQSRQTSIDPDPPGILVLTGTVENTSAQAVHHVVLRYELVDKRGKVVYRDEGFNRAAEALASPTPILVTDVKSLAPGATDTFRMLMLPGELPPFEKTRISVVRVY